MYIGKILNFFKEELAMGEGNSIISLGDVSKPVNTLIEKISSAIGVIYEPTKIIRKAKADAKAQEIMTISEINTKEIQQRAITRFIHEETRKQENIENIIEKAIPLIANNASSEMVEEDWLVNYFDKAKMISDDEMQMFWSRMLAEETNNAGKFSKKTINVVSDLDKQDALMFTNLCKFCFKIKTSEFALIYDLEQEIYGKYNIWFGNLLHLESIGLIQFDNLQEFSLKSFSKEEIIYYFDRPIKITSENEKKNNFSVGRVVFSQVGRELVEICSSMPEEEILNFNVSRWKENNIKVEII